MLNWGTAFIFLIRKIDVGITGNVFFPNKTVLNNKSSASAIRVQRPIFNI